jgi:putative DNA primase/helicase
MTAASIFRDVVHERLGVDPGAIIGDGNFHRFSTKPDGRDDAGYYVLHDDDAPVGIFGCWRSGVTETWFARDRSTMSPAARDACRQRAVELGVARDKELARVRVNAAARATEIWKGSVSDVEEHAYLLRKNARGLGIRQSRDSLVVPVRINGELSSLQFIGPDGAKKFLSGGAIAGGYHSIGKPDGIVVVCEGYATGATIHQATGHAVAVAFNAGNLKAVAVALRAKLPTVRIVIAADDDIGTKDNTGVNAARDAAVAVGGVVALPPFDRSAGDDGSDWNDFAALQGADAARQAFLAAVDAADPAPAKPVRPDAAAEIARLATLDPIAYDNEREEAAKRLGCRTGTLDSQVKLAREDRSVAEMSNLFSVVEPWPEPVDGSAVLDDVRDLIGRFIVSEPETRIAAALWIAFTWFIDDVQVAPLAIITAPEKRCGKTQLLELISRLTRRPLLASNISSAAVYRVIEAHGPTLLLDEADAWMRENEELRGVINSGHTRTSAFVIRTVGDDHEPRQFSTWGAKAISGIGTLPETLVDRAILLELRRKLPSETVERLRHAEPELFQDLARRLLRFAIQAKGMVHAGRPALPDTLNDRAQDNWEPLLAIAEAAGSHWPETARRAALNLNGSGEPISNGVELLADVKSAFEQDGAQRLSIASLVERLCADELGPWATWNRGKPISPRQLGKRLDEYGINAKGLRIDGGVAKGFERDWFKDPWSRYLPQPDAPLPPVTRLQVNDFNDLGVTEAQLRNPAEKPSVTANSLKNNGCYRVTDENPLAGNEAWEAVL